MKAKILAALAGATVASAAMAQVTYTGAPAGANPGVPIPDNSTTGVVFTVNSTFGGSITDMVLSLQFGPAVTTGSTPGNNFGHSWLGDLIVTLSYTPNTGPAITAQTILERVGRTGGQGGASGFGRNADLLDWYHFANNGSSLVGGPVGNINTVALTGGTTVPGSALVANGIQTTGYNGFIGTNINLSAFAAFIGADGTGTWTISVFDREAGDLGSLLGGAVTLVPAPGAAALLGLGGLVATRRRRA